MQSDSLYNEINNSNKLSSRGASIYYIGSAVFAAGIVLIVLATALVMLFEIHYTSEAVEILYTIPNFATGVILLLIGINLMIKQIKRGYVIIITSIIFSSLAIFLFYTNYLNNFYYPLISYIFGLYVFGFLILLGNAFASVIVWIIGNKPEYQISGKVKSHSYTDEEIQRDIEEATQKSLETAVEQLQFELEDLPKDIIIGKSVPESPGTVIRVKDDIDEVLNLSQTLNPSSTEKFGSIGIEKASMELAKTISLEKKKKSIFKRLKEKIFK